MARIEFRIRKQGIECGNFKANVGSIGGRIISLVSFDQLNCFIVYLQLILHLLFAALRAKQQKECDLVLIIPSMYTTHHIMSSTGDMAIGCDSLVQLSEMNCAISLTSPLSCVPSPPPHLIPS